MTECIERSQIKKWKSSVEASHNKDEFLDELVRILARSAAKQDFEEALKHEKTKTIH
ncbi:MAG: hypothetical protein AAGJ37_00540 [Pseudomonadota bacterium]